MAVGPIAEFQSQLPLWLAAQGMTSSRLSLGVTGWHCGVLLSVLVAGALFDKWPQPWRRGLVLAVPLAINAIVFLRAGTMPAGEQWPIAASFVLGATCAPVNYLSASTWTMLHVPPAFMPTVASIVDLGGYVGTLGVLQLQNTAPAAESGGDQTKYLMRLLGVSAVLCSLCVAGRFAMEEVLRKGGPERAQGKEKEKEKDV